MLNKKLSKINFRKETISNLNMAQVMGGVEETPKLKAIAVPTNDVACRYQVLAGSPADTELIMI